MNNLQYVYGSLLFKDTILEPKISNVSYKLRRRCLFTIINIIQTLNEKYEGHIYLVIYYYQYDLQM